MDQMAIVSSSLMGFHTQNEYVDLPNSRTYLRSSREKGENMGNGGETQFSSCYAKVEPSFPWEKGKMGIFKNRMIYLIRLWKNVGKNAF